MILTHQKLLWDRNNFESWNFVFYPACILIFLFKSKVFFICEVSHYKTFLPLRFIHQASMRVCSSSSPQVLETCVKNCGHRFHVQVANRDFIDGVLVKIISPKTNPPTIVQEKVLSLIQVLRISLFLCCRCTLIIHSS